MPCAADLLYDRMEWAGAFSDVSTLIPFVVACITIVKVEPLGLLFMIGIALLAFSVYYRTPLPIHPMKAIGAVAESGDSVYMKLIS
ncbi:MAG: putative sulfate/molybdate transporter [Syntrophales bacterium]